MEEKVNILLNIIKQNFHIHNIKINDNKTLEEIINILKIDKNSKFEKVGYGTYANVYKLSNKVLKIGFAKLDDTIYHHKLIVKIYLKKNLIIYADNKKLKIGIEIQDYADKCNPSESELFELYKNLRDNGIIWNDVKEDNVGKINGNIVVIDTDDLKNVNKTYNFINSIDEKFNVMYDKYKGE